MEKCLRQEHILKCARRVFACYGYHTTTVSHIIEEAGIARGTFYLYFESKREILKKILEEIIVSIKEVIVRIDPARDVLDQLRTIVEKVISILFRDADIPKILFNEAVGLDKGFDAQLNSFYNDMASIIKNSLETGISMGILRTMDIKIMSFAAMGALKEVVFQQTVTGNLNVDTHKILDEVLSFLLKGIMEKKLQINYNNNIT